MVVAVDLDDDGLDGGITLDQDAWRSELDVDLPSCKKIQKFKKGPNPAREYIFEPAPLPHPHSYISHIYHKALQAHILKPAFSSQTTTHTSTFTFTHLTHFTH